LVWFTLFNTMPEAVQGVRNSRVHTFLAFVLYHKRKSPLDFLVWLLMSCACWCLILHKLWFCGGGAWKRWVLKLNTGIRSDESLKNILFQCQLWITSHTHSLIWSCGHSPFRHSETINATHPSESFLLWAG